MPTGVGGAHLATAPARLLAEVSRAVSALGPITSLSVAFSGGVDSTVLLDALRRLRAELALPAPRALHVDHGLDACSGQWSMHCRQFCDARGLQFQSLSVNARPAPGQSPEEAARVARYQALREVLLAGEVLCVAHHADDQAETTLLQMLRGAGVAGGGAMRAERSLSPGRLCRPMLGVRRRDIDACAQAWGLSWIEDPANLRARHPRNRLRAEALPLLEDIAPGAVVALTRAAQLQREAADAVAELARLDWQQSRGSHPGSLSRRALRALSSARRRALLRLWMHAQVGMPSHARLSEVERQLCTARDDRMPCIGIGSARIELHGDCVLLFAAAPPPIALEQIHSWDPAGGALQLPHGRLSAQPCRGQGLRGGVPLTIRMRRGGERCKPQGRARSQTLKRLLQAHRIPAWQRHGLPLLYRGNELVAVADLWVCEGHAPPTGEWGWRLRWQPDRQPLQGPGACRT